MIFRKYKAIFAVASALMLGGAASPKDTSEALAAERIRAHVEFLASDFLEGRDTGSRGYDIAASYVASEFRKLGLKPGGEHGGWLVSVPFRRATHSGTTALALIRKGKRTPLAVGKDAAVRPSLLERDRAITAPLVFAGQGISDSRLGIDDYAGIDVRGKIVVVLSDARAGIPSDVASHLRSMQAATAARHGAVGLIEVGNGRRSAGQVERYATRSVTDWVDSSGATGGSGAVRANIAVSPEIAEGLFAGSRMPLAAIRKQVAGGTRVAGFDLPVRLALSSRSQWQDFRSPDVVGILPGSDPRLAAEHIVLMGHLDHHGIKADAKPGEDSIYNGALDNASGIATMIEAAREFADSGKRPRRSIMFIANTGEEHGLLGASYFAAHPVVPAGQIVGLVNLDMPLLLYDFTDVVAFGAEHSTIARAVAQAGSGMRIAVSPDPMPEESLFVRSDHYPFVMRGVPSVFLMTGHANGGKQAWQNFLSNVYHTPKDDLSQPINWRAGARFAKLNYRIARTLADAPARPRWYAGDYFGDTFAPTQPKERRQP